MNPLDQLLHDEPDEPTPLREALLRQTLSVVRQRRRVRQVARLAMFAACFVAGMLTMRWIEPQWSGAPPRTPLAVQTPIRGAAPTSPQLAIAPTKSSPYEHLRRAGDRERSDPRRLHHAVYRYSRAVALASNEQRAIDPEKDSWLLMALKLDQQSNQETRHERD